MAAPQLDVRDPLEPAPLIDGTYTDKTINDSLLAHVWRGAGKGWWACFARGAVAARPAGHLHHLDALQGHRAPGATTSRSAGRSASSTSSGGSASATPAR